MNPVSVSAPAKIVLFGEWGVTAGGVAIATALSPRFRLRWDPEGSSDGSDRRRPQFFSAQAQDAPEEFWAWPRFLWEELRLFARGQIECDRPWPLEDGLGSSSALLACCLKVSQLSDPTADVEALWARGRELLRRQSPRASALDVATQLWGGTLVFSDGIPQRSIELARPPELLIVHAGTKADTRRELMTRELDLKVLRALSTSAEAFVEGRDWVRGLREHRALLEQLGVIPPALRDAGDSLVARGLAEAWKCTGAGGGDALLFWVPLPRQSAFREACATLGWRESAYDWNAPPARFDAGDAP